MSPSEQRPDAIATGAHVNSFPSAQTATLKDPYPLFGSHSASLDLLSGCSCLLLRVCVKCLFQSQVPAALGRRRTNRAWQSLLANKTSGSELSLEDGLEDGAAHISFDAAVAFWKATYWQGFHFFRRNQRPRTRPDAAMTGVPGTSTFAFPSLLDAITIARILLLILKLDRIHLHQRNRRARPFDAVAGAATPARVSPDGVRAFSDAKRDLTADCLVCSHSACFAYPRVSAYNLSIIPPTAFFSRCLGRRQSSTSLSFSFSRKSRPRALCCTPSRPSSPSTPSWSSLAVEEGGRGARPGEEETSS